MRDTALGLLSGDRATVASALLSPDQLTSIRGVAANPGKFGRSFAGAEDTVAQDVATEVMSTAAGAFGPGAGSIVAFGKRAFDSVQRALATGEAAPATWSNLGGGTAAGRVTRKVVNTGARLTGGALTGGAQEAVQQ